MQKVLIIDVLWGFSRIEAATILNNYVLQDKSVL